MFVKLNFAYEGNNLRHIPERARGDTTVTVK